ncbi:MAG: hypothetical protein HYX69_22575 [Planctomycetia bacterium]|nr:hypothetical protein [Planctomycetia bacterium]
MQSEVDVEGIVREVLARLRRGGAAETPSSDAQPGNNNTSDGHTATDCLTLTDKLVTLATLENRLSGVRRVVLRRGAVVTPSARDALAERGVAVLHAAGAARGDASLVLGVADLDAAAVRFDPAAFATALAREGIEVERLAETGLASVVAELADHVERSGRLAVLLTGRPEAAACLANRRRGVRAVAGRDVRHTTKAIEDTAANLLALLPVGPTATLARLVKQFCDGWPKPCPAALDLHLK